MPEIIVRTIARFNKSIDTVPAVAGDIAIYRRDCAGRIYHVKGIMVGASIVNGVCKWQILPVYEWDTFDQKWIVSGFNRVHNVSDDDVLQYWNGAVS